MRKGVPGETGDDERHFNMPSDVITAPNGNIFDQRQYFPTQGRLATHSFIVVYDIDGRRITYMAPSVDRDTSPVRSPDGERLAFVSRPGFPFGHLATAPSGIPNDRIPPGVLQAKFQGGYTVGIWVADAAS